MQILSFCYGLASANMYVLLFGKEAVVIDPCCPFSETGLEDVDVKAALCTHGHFDHIFAVDDLRNKTTKVGVYKDDEHMLYEKDLFSSMVEYDPRPLYQADVVFDHEGKYKIDEFEFSVIHTPGHTRGGWGRARRHRRRAARR